MNEIIEFGKFKGQPVEVLRQEPQYAEWLMQQPWLKDRYPKIYNVVINNFQEPSETPEHNRLQARFLDEDFVLKVISVLGKQRISHFGSSYRFVRCEFGDLSAKCKPISNVKFEEEGVDISLSFVIPCAIKCFFHDFSEELEEYGNYRIEVKPMLGDDYPAVLREMANKKCNLLIVESFQSAAVDFEQLKKIFKTRSMRIISIEQIENANPDFGTHKDRLDDYLSRISNSEIKEKIESAYINYLMEGL